MNLSDHRFWFRSAFIAFIIGIGMVCASGGQGRGDRWMGNDPYSGTYDPATPQPAGQSWWEGGSGTSDNGWWGSSGSWDSGSDSGSWDSGSNDSWSDSGSWDSGGSDSGSWDTGGSDSGSW